MDTESFKSKIKQVEEQMEKLTIEKNEELKVKDDHILELKEIMLRQEQYMRSLGISLEEVKDHLIEEMKVINDSKKHVE